LNHERIAALFAYQNNGDQLLGRVDVEQHPVLPAQAKLTLRHRIGPQRSQLLRLSQGMAANRFRASFRMSRPRCRPKQRKSSMTDSFRTTFHATCATPSSD
jgi:hypothetical protein